MLRREEHVEPSGVALVLDRRCKAGVVVVEGLCLRSVHALGSIRQQPDPELPVVASAAVELLVEAVERKQKLPRDGKISVREVDERPEVASFRLDAVVVLPPGVNRLRPEVSRLEPGRAVTETDRSVCRPAMDGRMCLEELRG